jgi:hypothetical protein
MDRPTVLKPRENKGALTMVVSRRPGNTRIFAPRDSSTSLREELLLSSIPFEMEQLHSFSSSSEKLCRSSKHQECTTDEKGEQELISI